MWMFDFANKKFLNNKGRLHYVLNKQSQTCGLHAAREHQENYDIKRILKHFA